MGGCVFFSFSRVCVCAGVFYRVGIVWREDAREARREVCPTSCALQIDEIVLFCRSGGETGYGTTLMKPRGGRLLPRNDFV